jgi:hypothetical protein
MNESNRLRVVAAEPQRHLSSGWILTTDSSKIHGWEDQKAGGVICYANAGAVLKSHSQESFRMLSQKISPLGKPIVSLYFRFPYSKHLAQSAKKRGRSRSE